MSKPYNSGLTRAGFYAYGFIMLLLGLVSGFLIGWGLH